MRLERAINIEDLRAISRRRLPKMVFDYIDGGADDEIALVENVQRFRRYKTVWNALVNVQRIETGIELLGTKLTVPFFISPTASSRLFNPRAGELAVARAAHEAGTIYTASTLGSTSLESIASSSSGTKWFQVYMWKDRGLVASMLRRAEAAGYTGLVLTVDTAVAGNRERDPRNRFSIPPKVSLETATQALMRPSYLVDLIGTPRISAANITASAASIGSVVDFINDQFDRTVTWDDLSWIRSHWKRSLAIKGISTLEDAHRSADKGADAVWISNHGGRQLDSSPATIDLLDAVSQSFGGRLPIIFDGGVRRGGDIFKALALGASAVAIGRAYLWGLAAAGQEGVAHAIGILTAELKRTMALTGCADIASISRDHIFYQNL